MIALYMTSGQKGIFAFVDPPTHLTFKTYGTTNVTSATVDNRTEYTYTQGDGSTVLQFSNGVLIYLLETETAWNFFAVPTTKNPNVSPSEHIFALGPYLVREATIFGKTVSLVGDNANTTSIE